MKKVITYGTFDLLHYGHINILKRAKELGDHLTVVLSSDEFNELKGKRSVFNFEKRKELLEALVYVDVVLKEESWEQKEKDIIENDIDVFVMGDDWAGKFDNLPCKVVYLPRTEGISTTLLKSALNELEATHG